MSNDVPDLVPCVVTPASTLGEVAFAALRRQFAVYLAKQRGTRAWHDAEDVHDMRVATRRLRAAMSLFRDALPPSTAKLRRELKWVAAALGDVRDLDVQSERFIEWAGGDDAALDALGALGERESARQRLLGVLDSPQHRRLVGGFTEMLRRGPSRRNVAATAPATSLAPDIVTNTRRKLRKAAKRLTPSSPAQEYHALRIRGKRLRYALEFLGGVYGAPARKLDARMTAVQDLLGQHEDDQVARRSIAAALTRTDSPETAALLREFAERCARDALRLRRKFAGVYARTTGRPWRRLRRTMERMRVSGCAPRSRDAAAPRRARNASSRRTPGS